MCSSFSHICNTRWKLETLFLLLSTTRSIEKCLLALLPSCSLLTRSGLASLVTSPQTWSQPPVTFWLLDLGDLVFLWYWLVFGSLTLSSCLPGPAVLSGSFPPLSVFLWCSSHILNSFHKLIHSNNLFSGSSPNCPSRPDLPLLPPSPLLWLDPDWYSAIGRCYDLWWGALHVWAVKWKDLGGDGAKKTLKMLHPSIQVGALVSGHPKSGRAEEGSSPRILLWALSPSYHHPWRGGWKGRDQAQAGPGRKGGGWKFLFLLSIPSGFDRKEHPVPYIQESS